MSREDSRIEGEGGDQDPQVVSLPGSGPPPAWRGPDTPVAPRAEKARPTALAPSEHYAAHLHETSASAYLFC